MKFPNFIGAVIDKVTPITSNDSSKLKADCQEWHETALASAQNKIDTGGGSIIDKIVIQSDKWYTRLAFAVFFPVIVAFFQNLMNPGQSHEPDDMHDLDRR